MLLPIIHKQKYTTLIEYPLFSWSIVQKRGKLKNRKPIYRLKRKIGQK
ncbi:Uncharacterised protein [Streptococcus pneumoniae]|nr:Uncharacterised protein [Streptococcus pneumoniae]